MTLEMDYEKEARIIRDERPARATLQPDPLPYVGEIKVLRRKDGGYLLAALAADGQAGQLSDGALAVEVVAPEEVDRTGQEDHLAAALHRIHRILNQLRLEAALQLIATLREDRSEEDLIGLLRQALDAEKGQ